jgi:hypothetical protein
MHSYIGLSQCDRILEAAAEILDTVEAPPNVSTRLASLWFGQCYMIKVCIRTRRNMSKR